MGKIIPLILLFTMVLCSSSIDSQIKQKERELHHQKIEYEKMDKKLATMASKIINAQEEKTTLSNKISELKMRIETNKNSYKELQNKQKNVDEQLERINAEISEKQEKFISLVAEKFSMALVLEELNQPTSESIMLQETYAIYAQENEREIKLLKENIKELKIKEEYFQSKKENIQRVLANYQTEQEELKSKKYEKVLLLKALARDKVIYRERFDKIRSTQRALQRKLASLKIIKSDKIFEEIEAKRLAKAQQEAERIEKLNRVETTREQDIQQPPIAQPVAIEENKAYLEEQQQAKGERERERAEYQRHIPKVARYQGRRTISPLEGSRLIKKFGTYIDPIYKFKIFNKSITLKSSHKGAKVKSILRGRIVFAEDSGGMLGRVVIIEHDNQLHTIYAKLARLAPGIHVGKQVSKGSILGKVNKILMFEVTKNNKHMDPLKLIKL